ncbi:Asp23/Gls24 family envelope stress response protein [uncultured Parolsenella sp.]|uniref:Asp23/Gls24 family envelope stress response protein n=1 Tax=uncultured Parolsenella sp. TaxID=2083008 RepID=UPI00265AE72A|nr:Asp23/Gls24 family envelope stress response protein [uncultured Parolsenella sp.]
MSTKANVEETTLEPEVAEQPADSTVLAESESGDLTFSDADEDLDSEDSLTFSNGVIEKIVAISVRDVPGVLGMKGGFINRVQETFGAADPTKGVSVEVMPDSSVRVNISVLIEYGAYAPQVFEDVNKVVVKQVAGMTGLEVGGVNLRIEDVLTPEEYERMQGVREDAEANQEEE